MQAYYSVKSVKSVFPRDDTDFWKVCKGVFISVYY